VLGVGCSELRETSADYLELDSLTPKLAFQHRIRLTHNPELQGCVSIYRYFKRSTSSTSAPAESIIGSVSWNRRADNKAYCHLDSMVIVIHVSVYRSPLGLTPVVSLVDTIRTVAVSTKAMFQRVRVLQSIVTSVVPIQYHDC
jgi:hypothetical protein